VSAISLAVVTVGLGLAWLIYKRKLASPQQILNALAVPSTILQRRYYIDELYTWYVTVVQQRYVAGLCAWVEQRMIIGILVNGTAWLTQGAGRLLRLCQTGHVQAYALGFVIGLVWLLASALRP
jgi:NADH-quinone oxidoreductase subunit L